jgi:hypothetical protein
MSGHNAGGSRSWTCRFRLLIGATIWFAATALLRLRWKQRFFLLRWCS